MPPAPPPSSRRQSAGCVANASWQANPSVAASGNQALVVFEDGTGTTTASANIRARLFDGATNTLGTAFTIADHTARLRTPEVAALPDNRYVIVYGDQNDIFGRIYDPVDARRRIPLRGIPDRQRRAASPLNPSVAATVDGGFIVTWAESERQPTTTFSPVASTPMA